MANLNIKFNNKTYSIDSASLADATATLEAHLMGMMEERLEGDGAEFYTLAPTALSFRSTAPLNELQEIQINGVTVDPSNYTLEEGSTIVTFPIEYLKTLNVGSYEVAVASNSKTVKGGFSVVEPELNEHGFYYNQPYVGYVSYYSQNWVFFLREDGTMDFMILEGGYTETCNYEMDGSNITVNGVAGTFTGSVGATEIYCNEVATNFVLGDTSIAADGDYIYIYKEDLGGYEVNAIDKKKAEYGAIKTGINGIDTVKLADYMFDQNENLTEFHQIPNSVAIIGMQAFYRCYNLSSVTIPNSVTTILSDAFYDSSLTSIEIPASVTSIDSGVFDSCNSLTNISVASANIRYYSVDGILYDTYGNKRLVVFPSAHPATSFVIPNDVRYIAPHAFYVCDNLTSITIPKDIDGVEGLAFENCRNLTSVIYEGTTSDYLRHFTNNSSTKWYRLIPATHVHCTDGQVAL